MQQNTIASAPAVRPSAYRVGDLVVDVSRARVTRDGAEIPLPKLSLDLLLACIEAAPAIVSVDDLMGRVWPGLVVSPETVSQRVKLLRDALGDDSKSPRYIAGVRLRGYRLVANVEPLEGPGAITSASTAQPRSISWRVVALVCIVVLGIAGMAAWNATRDQPAPASRGAAVGTVRSIAVLPFENLSTADDGELLAFGIPEAILHQLANIPELLVIARTSSFALANNKEDARIVGEKLNARFLLEGSVQRDAQRLRITAQLIDSQTGAHLWSMRFDRTPQDVFAMQDEIALEVARALQLSLEPSVVQKFTGGSTANFGAYLAYLQGRAVMAKWRVADVGDAITHFSQAIRLDPGFAPAYVELAAAQLRQAEFEVTDDRQERFVAAVRSGRQLVEKALQIDARYGPAYAQRAALKAYTDLADAEADYRRGLDLSPNYAPGYAGLAAVLYENPRRRDEALWMLERARKLDPLEPAHDVTKAVFLLYGRSDKAAAAALLRDVLKRDPLNQPALMRLGEIDAEVSGQTAEGIKLLEQALSLDPSSEWTRRLLLRGYLSLGEVEAARQVADSASHRSVVREIPLYLHAHDWRRAGEAAYAAVESETNSAVDETMIAAAIRLHARATRDYAHAIETLEQLSGVTWDVQGRAMLPETLDIKSFPTALADLLQVSGDATRARSVLEATLAAMARESGELGRGDLWYQHQRPVILSLLGRTDAAIDALRAAVASGVALDDNWFYLEAEPSVARLSNDARFIELRETVRTAVAHERQALAELRRGGFVPQRTKK
jgi:TolB-like protein/DNA-binding winged helix-turn-helix (wHTH) protein/cytochrome c-type biogenesis protein CcmH/NrfG